ncbi:ABC transporter permease [Nocardiopsis sp. NPDC057823]|uniref:ABC transporter permease n=1 Tax=Nocardiopsis sp. NPDC057823 TaxID=3346256 RepID=UPI00159A353E|nr:ABC transporter permease [Nocardiopsis flavescens]
MTHTLIPDTAREAAPAPADPDPVTPEARRPSGLFQQVSVLARTEFRLFLRYKTALMYLALPGAFLLPFAVMEPTELVPGVLSVHYLLPGTLVAIATTLGLVHPANVLTMRREALVLKRLRVSGVRPAAVHTSMVALVTLLCLVVGAVFLALVGVMADRLPADPVMMALALLLSSVSMALLGTLISPLVRNGETAQMVSMVPMLGMLVLGGVMIPLDVMPDSLATVLRFLPIAPAVDMLRSGFLGADAFGSIQELHDAGFAELWVNALPAIGVQLFWIAVFAFLAHRFFRWDPRRS